MAKGESFSPSLLIGHLVVLSHKDIFSKVIPIYPYYRKLMFGSTSTSSSSQNVKNDSFIYVCV